MGVPKLKMLWGRTATVATMENSPITLFPRGCDSLWEDRLSVGPRWYLQDYLSPPRVCGRMHVGGSTNPMEMSELYWLSRLSGRRGELFSRNGSWNLRTLLQNRRQEQYFGNCSNKYHLPYRLLLLNKRQLLSGNRSVSINRDHPHVRNWNAPFEALFNQPPRSAERDIVINQQDLIDCIRFIYLQ